MDQPQGVEIAGQPNEAYLNGQLMTPTAMVAFAVHRTA